jgi:nucleoside-diphosphate-sugar epimerase
MPDAVILGCGYTGTFVARRLRARGVRVIATRRHASDGVLAFEASDEPDLRFIPEAAHVLYSIPVGSPSMIAAVAARHPARLVYLSTTSVYGATRDVDENTPVAPRTPGEWDRVRVEQAVLASGCSAMVLRPAAIYGPGRGVHVKMRQGRFLLAGDGSNFISRIHVEDLATIVEAAMFSEAVGAWPVADDEPCRSREIAEFCSQLLGVPMPGTAPVSGLHSTRRADRRVNAEAIRRVLGVELRYPSYRQGIPASAEP